MSIAFAENFRELRLPETVPPLRASSHGVSRRQSGGFFSAIVLDISFFSGRFSF
jgi:hypothetical protein